MLPYCGPHIELAPYTGRGKITRGKNYNGKNYAGKNYVQILKMGGGNYVHFGGPYASPCGTEEVEEHGIPKPIHPCCLS